MKTNKATVVNRKPLLEDLAIAAPKQVDYYFYYVNINATTSG
ncbi:hypothetical protein [Flocculibacter collagenilyticus]|nr:hypothetical protein [Flocculibacter collagenilyticus]